jgi:hypothetical protein
VPTALLGQPVAGVDQHDRQIRSGSAGDHIPRVLNVTRRIRNDELPPRCGEVSVGDIDRDALLAFGPQAVGQQRQVGVLLAALAAGPLDRGQLVLEDRLGVVEQPADEGALAVVHRACRGEAEDIHVPSAVGSVAGRAGLRYGHQK